MEETAQVGFSRVKVLWRLLTALFCMSFPLAHVDLVAMLSCIVVFIWFALAKQTFINRALA